ncbi:MAG: DUF1822 family protein [Symploca sp. SIO1C4]|uniref:DUF1822 family protein n=1 Tax=Symploca sp. SIO1C4 TaxID=2607765 RepID=A0A6B3N6W8_9CYAN|nr:DUF1822 family protein [Symploca sp. SIO1C4]
MIAKTQALEDWSIPMPITESAQRIAKQFASEQPTQEKAQQVYLNTLAVCAVNNYLRIIGISTNLTVGDSWNKVMRLAVDVADLWVSNLGRLECRPVEPGSLNCHIPQEVRLDRIAYIIVEIDKQFTLATLLGFSPTAASELPINQLLTLESLPEHLNKSSQLKQEPWILNSAKPC